MPVLRTDQTHSDKALPIRSLPTLPHPPKGTLSVLFSTLNKKQILISQKQALNDTASTTFQ